VEILRSHIYIVKQSIQMYGAYEKDLYKDVLENVGNMGDISYLYT
jgi:hypothetical protein